jgi:HlyD family secretion protein
MKWTFRIVMLVVALALGAGLVIVLRPQPLDVEVARVTKGPLAQRVVVTDARTRVRERYTVSAPVAGTLARIDLNEGDPVEPGTIVARLLPLATPLLDPASRKAAEQRLASAVDASAQTEATVARAKIASDQAGRDLARTEALANKSAVAPATLDQAKMEARMREAELTSADFAAKVAAHDIAQARAALARFRPGAGKSEQFEITSPVHGEVLHIFHKSEGVVGAGTQLLEIGDPSAIELVADVLSEDAVDIHPGMRAEVLHWGGGAPLSATVRRVEPAAFTKTSALGVDEQRVNVILDLDGTPADWRGLGDGFAVEIDITTWSKPDVIQVPTSALFRERNAWSVFVVESGHARLRAVQTGHQGPMQTEIPIGLEAGQVVVIHPGAAVRDGERVRFRGG